MIDLDFPKEAYDKEFGENSFYRMLGHYNKTCGSVSDPTWHLCRQELTANRDENELPSKRFLIALYNPDYSACYNGLTDVRGWVEILFQENYYNN